MTTFPVFPSSNYTILRSYTEETLSNLSHRLYSWVNQAKVIRNEKVRLELGKNSRHNAIALKIASYARVFSFALIPLVIGFGLRYRHNFTFLKSCQQSRKAPKKIKFYYVKTPGAARPLTTPLSVKRSQNSFPQPQIASSKGLSVKVDQKPSEASNSTAIGQDNIHQQVSSPHSSLDDGLQLEIIHPSSASAATLVDNNQTNVQKASSMSPVSGNQSAARISAASESSSISPEAGQGNEKFASISLEEFNKIIMFFSTYNKNSEQIVAELFKNVPENLNLTDLVNFIFNKCSAYKIPFLLKAITIKYPLFTLSPYDQIRRAIVEDTKHVLSNTSLMDLLKELALEEDEEKLTACYDLAYRSNHPYIYRLSRTPILPSEYNLNFLWVNLNPQDRIEDIAQNIFGNGLDSSENATCIQDPKRLCYFEDNEQALEKEVSENWNKIKKSFAYRISKWADVNPNAQINLWYDSALVTQKAQRMTFEMMRGISESRQVDIKLRDIRQLPNIGGETGNSLHPGTNVYYRVDLLKALITDYMMSSEESPEYCVVSDIDVQSMSPQHMFDQRTVDYLSSNGYVFNRVGIGDFENSFFIFNKAKEDIQKIHHKILIQKAASTITELRRHPINTRFKWNYILGAQSIYSLYRTFLQNIGEDCEDCEYCEDWRTLSRKVVKCPTSQFNGGGAFSKSDYQEETFRFIGSSNIPYTIYGRNFNGWTREGQIKELVNWQAEPLPSID